jgi:hypothetical protein
VILIFRVSPPFARAGSMVSFAWCLGRCSELVSKVECTSKGEDALSSGDPLRSISSLTLPVELIRWSALFGLV